jgi:hypothetical protein
MALVRALAPVLALALLLVPPQVHPTILRSIHLFHRYLKIRTILQRRDFWEEVAVAVVDTLVIVTVVAASIAVILVNNTADTRNIYPKSRMQECVVR